MNIFEGSRRVAMLAGGLIAKLQKDADGIESWYRQTVASWG